MSAKKLIAAAFLVLMVAFLQASCVSQRPFGRVAQRLDDRVYYFSPTSERVVALTIDDGPDLHGTPAILDALERHGVHATFFLIGSRASGNEELLARIRADEHELANHTFRDRASIFVSREDLTRELEATHEALSPYGSVRWFRPGSALFSSSMLAVAEEHGYRTALGDVYPYDAWIPSSRFHSWYILQHVRPGSVIVLHDSNGRGERTATTLEAVLPELHARGYRVVTLSALAVL